MSKLVRVAFQPHSVAQFNIGLASSLAKLGLDVHIYSSGWRGISGVKSHRVSLPFLHISSLKQRIIVNGYRKSDVVHINVARRGLEAIIARKKFGVPYVYTCHGLPFPDPDPSLKDVIMEEKEIQPKIIENSAAIVTLSNFLQKLLREWYSVDSKVIYNGVDNQTFKPITKSIARKHTGLKEDKKVILWVGRLHPFKSPLTLINSVPFVAKEVPEIQILIIGKGSEHRNIVRTVKRLNIIDRVKIIPFVENLAIYYSAADLFVHTAEIEGFGLVVLEAMACGRAAIVPNTASPQEIVGDAGLIFNQANPADLAKKIITLLTNKVLLKEMESKALARASMFTWDKAAKEYFQVYKSVIEKK